jgi:CIC family chloride channel protein
LDDIREVMFKQEEYDKLKVRKLMTIPRVTALLTDDVNVLMGKFEEYNVWIIPVTDTDGKYIGFVSKTGVLNQYREKLITQDVL